MTAKISEILDLQHKEIMYALEQMKEAEKLIWKEAMAKAGFQINVLILLALALERHKSISVCKPFQLWSHDIQSSDMRMIFQQLNKGEYMDFDRLW